MSKIRILLSFFLILAIGIAQSGVYASQQPAGSRIKRSNGLRGPSN